jgi:hypothetical protein
MPLDIGLGRVKYQPLRIPPGWHIDWNTFFEIDPSEESILAGFFGGSSLFAASNKERRLAIDLEWRPEDDIAGEYVLSVYYVPWERTKKGGRRKEEEVNWKNSRLVHTFCTVNRLELVQEVESVFWERDEWKEDN